jgi:N12 class adenine-specific DNA methylase
VLPPDLTPAEIGARLGAPWIPGADVAEFAQQLLADTTIAVRHSPLTATWQVQTRSWRGAVAATSAWGTGRADAYSLLEDTLNLRPTVASGTV